tara:strand:+ start:16646 stop:16759 length:114 start_codon:yes stop_codon:yes gene_type:complete
VPAALLPNGLMVLQKPLAGQGRNEKTRASPGFFMLRC